jgi:hypothetical protein
LLEAIIYARTPAMTLRAADRSYGFTVRALNSGNIEALNLTFEAALHARQAGRGG